MSAEAGKVSEDARTADQASVKTMTGLHRSQALEAEHSTESRPALLPITVRVPKAVELTGLSRTKLYELIKAKEIEVIKVGSSTLIVVASLHQFVERRLTGRARIAMP